MANEAEILAWGEAATAAGTLSSTMVEPDLNNEHTSIAIAPSVLERQMSHLPLMGKELVVT